MIWQSSRPIAAACEDPGCESRLKDARGAMFTAIDRANLTVHSIDPQEMVNFSPPAQTSPRAQGTAAKVAGLQSLSLTAPNTLIDSESMNVLPDRTGGRTVVGRNHPEQSIPEIFRENASYYVIGVERAVAAMLRRGTLPSGQSRTQGPARGRATAGTSQRLPPRPHQRQSREPPQRPVTRLLAVRSPAPACR